jgi:serine/threonine-protein kinase RsbT
VTGEQVALASDEDVVRARHLTRRLAVEAGLRLVDQTKLVTAVSELARNTVIHGGGGSMTAELIRDGLRTGVRVSCHDEGAGIADLDRALQDGYTSGNGLGLGFGGARRLVHDFDVVSAPGQGTTVTVVRWG